MLPKIRKARRAVDELGGSIAVQIDGGVTRETIERAADAGADTFVAGSSVYSAEDPDGAIAELRGLAQKVPFS